MRIGIIGAGAIGCLFGALLHKAGHQVTLVHRDVNVVASITRRGVRLREAGGKVLRAHVPAELAPANLKDRELVLITVKSYDTAEVARTHRRQIDPESTILTLQNGLGNFETLTRFFNRGAVLAGSTTEGSLSMGPGAIVHTGKGETWIGEHDGKVSERCTKIASAFQRAGLRTMVSRNMKGVLWSKAIVNAAINPFSALTRLPNGALAGVSGLKAAMLMTMGEGVAVSRAEGISLDPPDPSRLLSQVLAKTASNRSSMLQDIEKRKETEIRELNGTIVELGEKYGLRTPLNRVLMSLVLGLEFSGRLER